MFYRIDMTTLSVRTEERQYQGMGGRVLSSHILHAEVDAKAHPLSEHNKLVFAVGLLCGTGAPNAGRLSVAANSPLNGAVKDSNVGGMMGHKLGRLGIRGIIIEGLPQKETVYVLRVSCVGAFVVELPELKGLNIYDTALKLQEIFGSHTAIGCIGSAGENKMALACIGFTDMEGIPTRHAGRGGLGAVMGSKGIKAIVVDDCGSKGATFADEDVFRVGNQKMVDALTRHPVIKRSLLGQSCSPGCLICCPGESKHNNNWFFSRYLGIEEPGDRNLLNQLCDDYGIDTFETSAAIGVAITAGLLKLGDSQAIISMLREIARATILGRVLGAGSDVTRKVFAKVDAITVNRKHTIAHKRKNSEVFDNAGLCKFVSSALVDSPEGLAGIVQMCNARYGWNNTVDDF